MRELSINELFFVSGAGNAPPSGGGDTSGNNYGDISSSNSSPQSNKTPDFPWATTILGLAGSSAGGSLCGQPCSIGLGTTGAYLGHRIDNADWKKVGEDYKDYIHKEIKSGTIPPD